MELNLTIRKREIYLWLEIHAELAISQPAQLEDPLRLSLSNLAGVLGIPAIDVEGLFPFPIHRGCDDVGMETLHTVGIRGRVDDIGVG
jgi:hypothetical protein